MRFGSLGRVRARVARRRHLNRLAGRKLLSEFDCTTPEPTFVEIGANDGISHDHLRPYVMRGRWRGVMVEPVPAICDRLRANYADVERVAVENSAISVEDGEIGLWVVDPGGAERRLPEWIEAIGSVSREVVLRHAAEIPDIAHRLRKVSVPCLAFGSLLDKHGIGDPDLIVIDTEGHDAEIVRGIDVRRRRPRMLVYEHFHLSDEDLERTRTELTELGYRVIEEGFDSWCVDLAPGDRLADLATRLQPGVPAQRSPAVSGEGRA